MSHRTLLALVALAGAATLTASSAIASTKCFCNNGMTVQSMDDDGDDDDCNDACDEFGGGRLWTPADAQIETIEEEAVRRPVEGEVERPAGPGAIRR